MNVYLGDGRGKHLLLLLRKLGWGRLFVQSKPTPFEGERWGFDNAVFTDWRNGRTWDADAYRRRLEKAEKAGLPALAICPDIVGGGRASLDLSLSWAEGGKLPAHWPWYLAIQDGMTFGMVREAMGPFAGLFLGGTDAFKLQARDWCEFAHRHGKTFHFARAGTLDKARFALRVGADSLDSSFPLWTRERLDAFVEVMHGRERQSFFWRPEEAPTL